MQHELTTALNEVLDAERHALLKADYAALEPLQASKAKILTQLETMNVKRRDLVNVKERMESNQALIGGALAGIANAKQRIFDLQAVQDRLSVYDPTGRIEIAQNQTNALEKKA